MRVRHFILSSVAYLAVPYLTTLAHERHDFLLKKIIEHKISVLIFQCIFFWEGDRGSTVVKMLCYKSEGRWFDPSCRQWIFH